MSNRIDNTEDIVDSRDVIARIEALENFDRDEEDTEELTALKDLAEEGEQLSDWKYGIQLIRDSHFETYAQELAEDIGAVGRNSPWPLEYIDWEAAAEALKVDYVNLMFDGVEYWAR